ncbi:MAG: rhamnulokinase [Candidatus Lokiarchaeota archaeon]|nr:rhamnulokinase [Candidatus Lokiarchaeota archaeon]MBD3341975.1 rhamnulokinase [Candidatus Lokiarchaeota archaeon]
MNTFLGIDLGASSGRAVLGVLEKGVLNLEVIYRFSNGGILVNKSFYWDILRLYKEILTGLQRFRESYDYQLSSIGINTWGVDYVALDNSNNPIGFPYHYRDKRTKGILPKMYKRVPKKEIFEQTGIQFLPINTSTQLYSMVLAKSPQLKIFDKVLMVPDYFNFVLSGSKRTEYTIASTSQLLNPRTIDWAFGLIQQLGFNKRWFCKLVEPGTVLGKLRESVCRNSGLNGSVDVVTPACHDTASAVAAIPLNDEDSMSGNWAYISSGTWSLMGIELNQPLINDKVLKYNFTNEIGVNRTIRFLKNLTGMWIIQECKKIWNRQEPDFSWSDLDERTEKASPSTTFINPDDSIFLNPPHMIEAIETFCQKTHQEIPNSIGEISRTIFESLAFRYRQVRDQLCEISNREIEVLYIIGGGSQNDLLNQFTSNVLDVEVKAGPTEATVIGNVLVQAMGKKKVKSVSHMRKIVRSSFPIKSYTPKQVDHWEESYRSYLKAIEGSSK